MIVLAKKPNQVKQENKVHHPVQRENRQPKRMKENKIQAEEKKSNRL